MSTKKKTKSKNRSVFWVDIPTLETIQDENAPFINVADFPTKKQAVAWIREHIGNCDDDGNICLITEGEMN